MGSNASNHVGGALRARKLRDAGGHGLFGRHAATTRQADTDNEAMPEVSARLTRWIVTTFPAGSADRVLEVLRAVPDEQFGRQDVERVHAAIVIRTNGDWDDFVKRRALAARDWRDVLVAASLAQPDWPDRLDAVLGPK